MAVVLLATGINFLTAAFGNRQKGFDYKSASTFLTDFLFEGANEDFQKAVTSVCDTVGELKFSDLFDYLKPFWEPRLEGEPMVLRAIEALCKDDLTMLMDAWAEIGEKSMEKELHAISEEKFDSLSLALLGEKYEDFSKFALSLSNRALEMSKSIKKLPPGNKQLNLQPKTVKEMFQHIRAMNSL